MSAPEEIAGDDPFAGVFQADGSLDIQFVGRRLPALYTLLRSQPECFDMRIDLDVLSAAIGGDAGSALHGAEGAEALDAALRVFSREHLHELIAVERMGAAHDALAALAADEELPRKKRQAAAVGVALSAGLPDERGFRGRGLGDVILRISLEELQAHRDLRRRASQTEGGLSADELQTFWEAYPAVRHHFEERYRRDVAAVVAAIEADVVPTAISVDLALRGVHRLLVAAGEHNKEDGGSLDGDVASQLLRTAFDSDLLDDGRELVLARWFATLTTGRERDGAASDDPDLVELERALRVAGPGGPGGEVVFFQAYSRAVVEGSFHVRDDQEAGAARAAFGERGLDTDGVLSFATHLSERGDAEAEQRVLLAALELWPDHEGVRAAATQLGEERMRSAGSERQGPTYDDAGETFSEID